MVCVQADVTGRRRPFRAREAGAPRRHGILSGGFGVGPVRLHLFGHGAADVGGDKQEAPRIDGAGRREREDETETRRVEDVICSS